MNRSTRVTLVVVGGAAASIAFASPVTAKPIPMPPESVTTCTVDDAILRSNLVAAGFSPQAVRVFTELTTADCR